MKIAIIIPSLANKGPVRVVSEIVRGLNNTNVEVQLFYFDRASREIEINVPKKQISFFQSIDFEEFDIVHSHGMRPDLYLSLHSSKKHKSKRVSTMHNIMFEDLKYTYGVLTAFFATIIWKMCLIRFDAIVVLSKHMLNYYSTYNNKLILIKNGLTPINYSTPKSDLLHINQIVDIKTNYRVVGIVANLIKRKGIQQALHALVNLENYYLLILGDGSEYENLKNLSKKIGVDKRVLFMGYIPNPQDYYTFFDIYLLTSFSEGLPLSVIDAASLGIPIVSSEIPSMTDAFSHEEMFFFKLRDIGALRSAIIKTELKYNQLAQDLKNKYFNELTAEIMCQQYLRLYSQLIKN